MITSTMCSLYIIVAIVADVQDCTQITLIAKSANQHTHLLYH